MSSSLAEVPLAEAAGPVAEVYGNLMTWSGSGSPALIFRHLATFPGLLEWCWRAVGPELQGGALQPALLGVVDSTPGLTMAPLPPTLWDDLEISDDDRMLIVTMLLSYDRMNTVNFGLISAIRDVVASPEPDAGAPAPEPTPATAAPPPAVAPMPPPVDVDTLPPDLREAVLRLAEGVPDTDARVVPTLYRHLAIWPPLMLAIATPLLAEFKTGAVDAATERLRDGFTPFIGAVSERARRRAETPPPVADAAALVRTLDAFLVVIPQLVVVGRAIRAALPAVPPR